MEGQLYWATGQKGTNEDLAGLVCNNLKDEKELCINELRGSIAGDSWKKRAEHAQKVVEEELRKEKEKRGEG